VDANPPVLTPDSDGINDDAVIEADLGSGSERRTGTIAVAY
jgi:hypothetical protein